VALIVETSVVYGRQILRGISQYLKTHAAWSVFLDERELRAPPPEWLSHWRGDGVNVRDKRTHCGGRPPALNLHLS
jgi:LacI family transcriptional regulator